jgi:hypothetical protein
MKRRPTVELKAMIRRENTFASPPPPPANITLREWFAGLAISNSKLMDEIEPSCRAAEAIRIADELIGALATAKLPSKESMAPPSTSDMISWDDHVKNETSKKVNNDRPTIPGFKRRATISDCAVPPDANVPKVSMFPPTPPKKDRNDAGVYKVVTPSRDWTTKGNKR